MMRSDLIDLPMHLHIDRPHAIFASTTGEKDDAVWLPKSQIEIEQKDGRNIIVTLPQWLAEEKGLV